MTGLTKVLPAPDKFTFSLLFDLHAVSAPITATAASAAVIFLVIDTLHKRKSRLTKRFKRNVHGQRYISENFGGTLRQQTMATPQHELLL
jgi:predicted protein tyrosine phosphatase